MTSAMGLAPRLLCGGSTTTPTCLFLLPEFPVPFDPLLSMLGQVGSSTWLTMLFLTQRFITILNTCVNTLNFCSVLSQL